MSSRKQDEPKDNLPESIEEAAALLGATITQMTGQPLILPRQLPPKGMHSAWSTYGNLPSTELVVRLHTLRAFLRGSSSPLVAARSILALLMKLIGISSTLAAQASSPQQHDPAAFLITPPLLSNPIRKLWCDSVVLCHGLGGGGQSMETIAFVRQMLALAVLNPRSARAAGGVRIAAVQVVAGLLEYTAADDGAVAASRSSSNDTLLAQQLAPWSLEILQTTLRALKSAGHNEPTYRITAMQMACAAATACQRAFVKTHKLQEPSSLSASSSCFGQSKLLVLPGAMEDKAIAEAIKVLKQAVTDKFPEVRCEAAQLAARLAPMLILPRSPADSASSPALALDEVMQQLVLRNLDDDSAYVAMHWADAMARCMATAIEYNRQQQANRIRRSESDDGDGAASPNKEKPMKSGTLSQATSRFGAAKKTSLTETSCSSLSNAIAYLVDHFLKIGGELNAQKMGGPFSTGGRAARAGLSLALTRLLRLQSALGNIGEDQDVSVKKCIGLVLGILGEDMEKELNAPLAPDATALTSFSANPLFGGAKGRTKGDPCLVRLAASGVLRQGLSEVATETVQLMILHTLVGLLEGLSELNGNQIQVLLIEISHLLSALGEAASSSCDDVTNRVLSCLSFNDHGVRHEAAIACAAIAASFPATGRKLIESSLAEIRTQHAELVAKLSSSIPEEKEQVQGLGRFRRSPKDVEQTVDTTLPQQYVIHGRTLMVSLLIRDLIRLPGGLPLCLLNDAIGIAEILIALQFDGNAAKSNPGAVCMCVISGFTVISGILATGPTFVAPHTPFLIAAWQKSCASATEGTRLQPRHDLFCMDAVLASTVAFLKYCPELLLTIPEALAHLGVLLEQALQLFLPNGHLGRIATQPAVAGRYERALASLFESFAWLPSGSFPMAADDVFKLAAKRIQMAIESDTACSVLVALVNHEDSLLNSKTLCRAKSTGQSGSATGLEELLAILTSECVGHGEREAVIHLLSPQDVSLLEETEPTFDSAILAAFAREQKISKPPTPLHDVGSWHCPLEPSMSSKVRLVDAAIQAFAATFGLRSGQEQQEVVDMLESLVPVSLTQFAHSIGRSAVLPAQENVPKQREGASAAMNIAAVLLACLRAIPLQDSTKNNPIGLGSQWMNRAKSLLLTILPSASDIVRCGVAESLAFLVTVGVTEDAHFLQSALLHSIDDVMQGNKPDGKPRTLATDQNSAARSGSLLTLGCIQRTQNNVTKQRESRVRERTGSSDTAEHLRDEESLPLLQMMTRVLPSAAYHGPFREFVMARAYALQSYAILLAYSGATDDTTDEIDLHLLRKGIELVEGNFVSCWTAVTGELDRGQDDEKVTCECAFLTGMLRLMTIMTPHLYHFRHESTHVAERFSIMARIILEISSSHPTVMIEGMSFFETLAAHRDCLPSPSNKVPYMESPLLSVIPVTLRHRLCLPIFAERSHMASPRSRRASVHAVKMLGLSKISVSQITDMDAACLLLRLQEFICSSRHFSGYPLLRSLAAHRHVEVQFSEVVALEKELVVTLRTMVTLDRDYKVGSDVFLRWILFSRGVVLGTTAIDQDDAAFENSDSRGAVVLAANARGGDDASNVLSAGGPPRWQVKTLAIQLATTALDAIGSNAIGDHLDITGDPNFDPVLADKYTRELRQGEQSASFRSKLVYHLEDLLATACLASSAAIDQSELRALQSSAIDFLAKIVTLFGRVRDSDNKEVSILHQFMTQIISAIRNALVTPGQSGSYEDVFLFVAGCHALDCAFRVAIITDNAVTLRLVRSILPDVKSFVFLERTARSLRTEYISLNSEAKSEMFVELTKVVCIANLYTLSNSAVRSSLVHVLDDLLQDTLAIATMSAVICDDGAKLLIAAGRSLAGRELASHDDRGGAEDRGVSSFKGLSLNQPLLHLLVEGWASCGNYALMPLLKKLRTGDREDNYSTWINDIVALHLLGVHDVCDAFDKEHDDTSANSDLNQIDIASVLCACLSGLGSLVEECPVGFFDTFWESEIESIFERLWRNIIIPSMTTSHSTSHISGVSLSLVYPVCDFLMRVVRSDSDNVRKDTTVLMAMLKPLGLLQERELLWQSHVDCIVTSCLDAAAFLVTNGQIQDNVVSGLLKLVVDTFRDVDIRGCPETVKKSASLLMKSCLKHEAINGAEKSRIAVAIARQGMWEAWATLLSVDNGVHVMDSLEIVSESLLDYDRPGAQLAILVKLREALMAAGPGHMADLLLSRLGEAILNILYHYGTMAIPPAACETRQLVCADAVKILLISYQHISSEASDDEVAELLLLLFRCLLSIMQYNGLPNHPAPSPKADAALGRMCTQAITSIARTTPVPFKMTMTNLSDNERQLLEFSVRAEMSGYAVAENKAPIKKLNARS